LRDAGRLASPLGAAGDDPGHFSIMAQLKPENLQRLAELIDNGTARVAVQQSFQLDHAAEATQTLRTNHTREDRDGLAATHS
jgi:hypothetical protein